MASRNIAVTNMYYSINRYKNLKKKILSTFWIYNEIFLFDEKNVICVEINTRNSFHKECYHLSVLFHQLNRSICIGYQSKTQNTNVYQLHVSALPS
jgi:hypothetical protein